MVDESPHSVCVSRWLQQAGGSPVEAFLQDFERAFAAIWQRAHLTLGDVTLTAIVDRVIYTAAERFPMLSPLKVDETGLHCHGIRERALGLSQQQVEQGIRFVLVEFLTILGTLTADVLTPALHAELSKLARERVAARNK